MRILMLLVMGVFLLAPGVFSIAECKNIQPLSELPCVVTTTFQPTPPCSQYSVIIFDEIGINQSNLTLQQFGVTGLCAFNFTTRTPNTYHYNITTGDTGTIIVENDAMLAIILGLGILVAYFGIMGYFTRAPGTKFLSFALSFVEIVMLVAFLYANNLGNDMSTLLRANFYIMLVLGFGVAMLAFFSKTTEMMDLGNMGEQSDAKWQNKSKWRE